jgi:hypothetical protein
VPHRLAGLLAAAALASASVGLIAAPPAIAAVSAAGYSQGLASVYCTATANCWSIGYAETSHGGWLNQILHWTGKKWAKVPAPNPGGTTIDGTNNLASVRCVSAANCWAVGNYSKSLTEFTQALHWNGTKWTLVTTPDPGGSLHQDVTELLDVACTSASSCWAVGDYGKLGMSDELHNLAVHWNGKKWSKVKTPNPAGTSTGDTNSLAAVRCASATNCWAVGGVVSGTTTENEILHWNGAKWSATTVTQPAGTGAYAYNALTGLSCTAASDCWAIGAFGLSGAASYKLNEALRWNGASWKQAKMPNPDGTGTGAVNFATAINCSTASNCWTVGYSGSFLESEPVSNEALHWNGTKWSRVKLPDPGGSANGDYSRLASIRCVSAKDCWAAGYSQPVTKPSRDQLLHWNSRAWSVG